MQSKIGPVPFVAILFVLSVSVIVSVLVSLYLTLFAFRTQNEKLTQVGQEIQLLFVPTPTLTPVATPTATLTPTKGYSVPVKPVVTGSIK